MGHLRNLIGTKFQLTANILSKKLSTLFLYIKMLFYFWTKIVQNATRKELW